MRSSGSFSFSFFFSKYLTASGIPYYQSVSVGGNKMWYTLKFPTQYEINKISIKTDAANEQYLEGVEVQYTKIEEE